MPVEGLKPREYQENIAKSVLSSGSTLVVLPTALGKTLIGTLVAEKKVRDGKILFMAPTRPLVEQHAKSLKSLLGLEVSCITGLIPPEKRRAGYSSNRIVCATPQTIDNDVQNRIIDLSEYSLVVFDEAHRAVGDYAYVRIAEAHARQNYNGLRLGLTASPGSSASKINEIKENLRILRTETRTEQDPDVSKYVHDKKVHLAEVTLPEEYSEPLSVLKKACSENRSWLKERKVQANSKTQLLEAQRKLSKKVKENPILYSIMSRIALLIKLDYLTETLETQGPEQALAYYRGLSSDTSKAAARILADERISLAMEKVRNVPEHPKMLKVSEILSEEGAERAIVFSNYRDTASRIEHFLSQQGFECKRFIGQSNRAEGKGYSQKEQARVIQDFRDGIINVLVATSIGEEGLDIPSVDLTIFYEPVPSGIRMIQRKGRTGRHGPGKVCVLMAKGTRDQAYYWSSLNKEKKMIKELKKPQKTIGDYS